MGGIGSRGFSNEPPGEVDLAPTHPLGSSGWLGLDLRGFSNEPPSSRSTYPPLGSSGRVDLDLRGFSNEAPVEVKLAPTPLSGARDGWAWIPWI